MRCRLLAIFEAFPKADRQINACVGCHSAAAYLYHGEDNMHADGFSSYVFVACMHVYAYNYVCMHMYISMYIGLCMCVLVGVCACVCSCCSRF